MQSRYQDLINSLCFSTDDYVRWTLVEFGEFIPKETREYVQGIKEYKEILVLNDKPTVTFVQKDGKILIPKRGLRLLEILRFIPGYGIKPDHKCYKSKDVLNESTYLDYVIHVFLAGLTMEQFCNETLPHEVLHLCGSRGWEPFFEGLTELKAREVAAKYDFPLSRCGYNKEVDIVVQVQDILGRDLMSKIAFTKDEENIRRLIESEFGKKTYRTFMDVREYMMDCSNFSRVNSGKRVSVIKKIISYSKVKYPDIESKLLMLENTAKSEIYRNNLIKEDENITYAQNLEIDDEKYRVEDSSIKVHRLYDDR